MGEAVKEMNRDFFQEWFENNCTVQVEYLDYGYGLVAHGELIIDHHNYVWDIVNVIIDDYKIEVKDGYHDFIVKYEDPDENTHRIIMGITVRNGKIDPYSWYWEEIFNI